MPGFTATLNRNLPIAKSAERAQGLSVPQQVAVFAILLLLVFSRRPQDLFHAQFYAEDGNRWFAQAYNLHWLHSILVPDASYLQILPRLVAGVALLLPLHWAPLVMNLCGGVIQVLPVTALLSSRCSTWGSLPVRAAMAAVYIADPNAVEVHINITNAQWHLALLQVFLAFALPPKGWIGRCLDVLVFLLGAFSGPFDIVLLPLMLVYWYKRRERWTLILACCLACGASVQVHSIATGATFVFPQGEHAFTRAEVDRIPLGASPSGFVEIVGGDVFLNSEVGSSRLTHYPFVFLCLCMAAGTCLLVYGLLWGPIAFRLFAVYALILFAGSLKSPVIPSLSSRWDALILDAGMRYYFFPSLLFLWAAIYCAVQAQSKLPRYCGYAVLLLCIFGTVRKWEYSAFPDHHFAMYVDRFNHAKSGDSVVIPIYPDPWTVKLIKH